jgi:hypothetical protein
MQSSPLIQTVFDFNRGFVNTQNGGTVSWSCSTLDTVADSTIEAEYIADSKAAKEFVWIKSSFSNLL